MFYFIHTALKKKISAIHLCLEYFLQNSTRKKTNVNSTTIEHKIVTSLGQ